MSVSFSYMMKMLRLRAGFQRNLSQMRRDMDAFGALFPAAANVDVRRFEICGRPVELIIPQKERSGCVLIYLHGGGYVMGSIQSHRHLASRIASTSSIKTLVLDYRLAPEHPFPAAINDAAALYEHLLKSGMKSDSIALVGDSAGGGLCVSLMVELKRKKCTLPQVCVCLSPWVDLTQKNDSWIVNANFDHLVNKNEADRIAAAYLDGETPYNPIASPLFADMSGMPPVLIHAGSKEVLLDDALLLHKRMKQCGVKSQIKIWNDMPHVGHFMSPVFKKGQMAIDHLAKFIGYHLKKG